ncbi:ABC transporter permease [archaeon]|nr:ABC transporter permease [archaeon]
MRTILFLAFRDMVRDKKIVTLVVFLLAFSYINLTFFPAFLNGLSDTFQNSVIDTGTSHIIIQPESESGSYLNFESSTRKKIDLIPGVVGASSHISSGATIYFKGRQISALLTGLVPSDDYSVTTIHSSVTKGEFLSDSDDNYIVLGNFIAGQKIEDTIGKDSGFGQVIDGLGGVDVGEKVTVKFSNSVEKEYRVKGIAESTGFSYVAQSVYITKKEADSILGTNDKASSILVKLNNKEDADRYKKLILELGIPNAKVLTWEEATTFTKNINQTFSIVILVTTIVGVIIVMSTIGIVIFINTSRKKRIIGVLKAIGMQQSQIKMIYLFESVLFGIIGTLIGIIIVYASIFYFAANPISVGLGYLQPILPVQTAISAVIIMIMAAVIAGYLPARMASKQDILENIKTVE